MLSGDNCKIMNIITIIDIINIIDNNESSFSLV